MRSLKSMHLPWIALLRSGVGLLGNEVERGVKARQGLDADAQAELAAAGVDQWLGAFTPISSTDVGEGWTKHTFDPDGGNGPIRIAGTDFPVFTREGDPSRLPSFEQGGGACWQNFYGCDVLAEAQEPPTDRVGIWDWFVVAGDAKHTALQTPLLYTQDANGVLLNEWTDASLVPRPCWVDIVEDADP